MTWTCLSCGAENPATNLICGSETCQLRRMREWIEGPQPPASAPAFGPATAPATPALAAVEGVSSLDLRSKASPKKQRHSYPAEFEAFWSVYPRKQDKTAAMRAWKRAVAGGASPAELREAAVRYRNNPKRDPDYTKYAERWLNAGAWMDEPEIARPDSHQIQETDWEAMRAEDDARIAALLAEQEAQA